MKQYRPAPSILHVEIDKGQYQVCESENGGTGPHHRIGPKFPTGKEAYRYADTIEERRREPISPLRVEASPLDAKQSPPPASVLASNEAASA